MTKFHKNRLLKLAKHLREGKLGHEVFDYTIINGLPSFNGIIKELHSNGCGTHGCALGECPIAFPKHWVWMDGRPNLRIGVIESSFQSAQDFFNITEEQAFFLFLPSNSGLGLLATKEMVAAHIEKFVASQT